MAMTVIGVFDSARDAQLVHEDLVQAGIAAESIETHGPESDAVRDAAKEEERGQGLMGWLHSVFGAEQRTYAGSYSEAVRRGGYLVSVVAEDTAQAQRIEAIMEQDGAIDVDERARQWRSEGWTDDRGDAPAEREGQLRAGETERIPVIEEELTVGKREEQRGRVRVASRVFKRPVEAEVTLREEHAEIERHPVDRPASEAELRAGMQGQTIEVTERTEEPVVAKKAHVVEEVEVGKRATEHTEVVRDEVRETRVEVVEDDREAARKGSR
jgi:stress response protein YsnF